MTASIDWLLSAQGITDEIFAFCQGKEQRLPESLSASGGGGNGGPEVIAHGDADTENERRVPQHCPHRPSKHSARCRPSLTF